MKTAKPTSVRPNRFLRALIRTAYLPSEIPPAITTSQFAQFCDSNYVTLKGQHPRLLATSTKYATFTAPRAKSGRRNLALVHPLAQVSICLLITQKRKTIKKTIDDAGTSLYRTEPAIDRERAFIGLDFDRWNALRAKVSSEYPFVLQSDISRFFYTIYTHSIPWAVLGKERTKELLFGPGPRVKLTKHWANHLDRAIQLSQSRETFGIPVGPDTSRIIAEVLLAGIERDSRFRPYLHDRLAFRLVDDLVIGFERQEDAYKALAALRLALREFNLQLNEEKTSVIRSRALVRGTRA
jgi:hypothetical protein